MSGLVLAATLVASHLALAAILFFGVNWIGKHAVEFGYASTTLFEEVNDSVALNFFLRAMSPAIFIIAVSALTVAIGRPEWRIGIHLVPVYYYALRAAAIFLLNRQRLVSWPRFVLHAAVGTAAAMVAYYYLILPNRSLLPNLEQMGNEVWLIILAFLYAVANNVTVRGGPGARRRNNFISTHYARARARYGSIIDKNVSDEALRLITYAILVYEDYARPAAIRELERLMFWKRTRTTGIMQVGATTPLTDAESVAQGTNRLIRSWEAHRHEEYLPHRVRKTIADYNADDDYVGRVLDVMEILAARVDTTFRPVHETISRYN